MSTSGIDVITFCSSKFELHKIFEKIVKVSSSSSVSYTEQLICRTVDYTSVLVPVTDYKFTLISCLHSFDFLTHLMLAITNNKMFHLFSSSNV